MSTEVIERRYISAKYVQLRKLADGKKGMEGLAARFNSKSVNLGGFREQLMPGCFTNALSPDYLDSDSDVKALFNHDPNLLLGRTQNGSLVLEQNSEGLHQSTDFLDTQDMRDIATKLDARLITQQSFAFTVSRDGDSWTIDENGDNLRSIMPNGVARLYDVSPVTYPAYTNTTAGVRSALPHDTLLNLLTVLVRCEHGLKVTKTELDTLKEYNERFEKILKAGAMETEAPQAGCSVLDLMQRTKALKLGVVS